MREDPEAAVALDDLHKLLEAPRAALKIAGIAAYRFTASLYGFLEYVKAVKASGKDSLWPSLPLREGKPSDLFGRWFKDHRNALGITGARPDFHCFRHTVRPIMRKAGHREATMDEVTGHKTVGSIGTTVYDHRTLEEVQGAVEAIRYESPRLSWRLNTLRGLSHEEVEQVLTRGA